MSGTFQLAVSPPRLMASSLDDTSLGSDEATLWQGCLAGDISDFAEGACDSSSSSGLDSLQRMP